MTFQNKKATRKLPKRLLICQICQGVLARWRRFHNDAYLVVYTNPTKLFPTECEFTGFYFDNGRSFVKVKNAA